MYERMTEEAREAIALAEEEVLRFGRDRVGNGPLLLGLLGQEDSLAARALSSLGVTLEDAREQVAKQPAEPRSTLADHPTVASNVRQLRPERPPENRHGGSLTRRPQSVLERAARQAEIFGHYYVGTPHFLLGLVEDSEGMAVRVLSSLGVEPPDVRRTVMEMLRSGEYGEKKRGGLPYHHRGGRRGGRIRLEPLDDERLVWELKELLVLTGIVGVSKEPPRASLEPKIAARIERAVEDLGSRIEMMRYDLLGLESVHQKLAELLRGG